MMRQQPPARPPLAAPAELIARADLSSAAKVCWMGLAQFVGTDGLARPRLTELQQVIGMADKTLRRALAELVNAGVVSAIRMAGGVTAYVLNPGQNDRTPAHVGSGQNDRSTPRQVVDLPPEFADGSGHNDRPPRARASSSPSDIGELSTSLGEEEGGAGGRRRARRTPIALPTDWLPSTAALEYAADLPNKPDASRELIKFRQYFQSKGTLRADWDLTFMRWMDRASPAAVAAPVPGAGASGASRRPMSGGMAHLLHIIEEGS
jgi:hypothetical protein